MTDRLKIDRLLRDLYAARVRSDLDGVCRTFSHDAEFQIAGAGRASPVTIRAFGIDEIRSWLALLMKTFQLSDHQVLTEIIEGAKAAVHWRTKIYSRITGASVATELIDLVLIRDDRITSFIEFFVPRET